MNELNITSKINFRRESVKSKLLAAGKATGYIVCFAVLATIGAAIALGELSGLLTWVAVTILMTVAICAAFEWHYLYRFTSLNATIPHRGEEYGALSLPVYSAGSTLFVVLIKKYGQAVFAEVYNPEKSFVPVKVQKWFIPIQVNGKKMYLKGSHQVRADFKYFAEVMSKYGVAKLKASALSTWDAPKEFEAKLAISGLNISLHAPEVLSDWQQQLYAAVERNERLDAIRHEEELKIQQLKADTYLAEKATMSKPRLEDATLEELQAALEAARARDIEMGQSQPIVNVPQPPVKTVHHID